MAIAVVTMNKADAAGTSLDPSRVLRAYHKGSVKFLAADTISQAINIKQFSAIGLLIPALASAVAVEIWVSDSENGTYLKLEDFVSGDVTAAKAKGTTNILEWPWMQIRLQVADASAPTIPFTLS